jgi:pimeloyl-ACP methyl ester carboxylesterase
MAQIVEGVKNLMSGISIYDLGDFQLQSGASLPGAWIAYKTFGDPKSPAILYPSWYSGAIADNEWLIGEDKTLNPQKYFIIITALFGNGQSISPSNSSISPFPDVTFYDNVRAQHALLTQKLNITHLRCVTGWSMGAGQCFQWATQYPDFMDTIVPFCGSAKTSIHNQVFLEGVKSALLAAKHTSSAGSTFGRVETASTAAENRKWTNEEKTVGLKAFGRGYAGWGFSQAFYREKLHEKGNRVPNVLPQLSLSLSIPSISTLKSIFNWLIYVSSYPQYTMQKTLKTS